MAEVKKFGAKNMNQEINHALRELPPGKAHSNEDIVPELTHKNYSLLNRCQTASEAIKYRTELEKEIFRFKRKNLVREVGIIVQCPSDCPADQKADFFRETYSYICSTLPMGERCVVVAQVHVDERKKNPFTGEIISKDHLHVLFVPAVKDSKHDGFSYRLCADQLIKKKYLYNLHDGLQQHLDKAGIKATVKYKKSGDGKGIHLSVSQLKTLTESTGITLDHSLTIEELSKIINTNVLQERQLSTFKKELAEKEAMLEAAQVDAQKKISQENILNHQRVTLKESEISSLKQTILSKEADIEKLKAQTEHLQNRIVTTEKDLKEKSSELSRLQETAQHLEEKISALEKENTSLREHQKGRAWGHTAGWGTTQSWGKNPIEREIKEDITI